MTTPPTPEELLRLARKAWPDTAADLREPGEDDPLSVDYAEHDCTARVHNPYEEDSIALTITHPERAQQALHAALLVLAGEHQPQRDVLDFVRLCVRLRNTDGSDEAPTQQAALEWLSTLEDP